VFLSFKKNYYKLFQPENWKFWITISLVVKTLLFIYFISLASSLPADAYGFNYKGSWAKAGGDAPSYFEPIENLLSHGVYYDDYRMPGYGWLYFLLRLFVNPSLAFNFIIIIQLLFSALSVYALALVALMAFRKHALFYITFFLYLFSTFVSINDHVLMTESLCVSSLIISLFFYLKYYEKKTFSFLFYSGVFMTWSIFLRPVVLPILILYGLFLIIKTFQEQTNFKVLFKHLLVLFVPFIIIDGAWVYRNYMKYNRVIFLQKTTDYTSFVEGYVTSMRSFVRSFGGNDDWWENYSAAKYFMPESAHFEFKNKYDSTLSLIPEEVYTRTFNKDSLINLRNLIILKNSSKDEKDAHKQIIRKKFSEYEMSIRKEKPFLFYIQSRLKCLRMQLFFTEFGYGYLSYTVTKPNNRVFNIFTKIYTGFYYFVLTFGLIGFITVFLKYYNKWSGLESLIFLIGIFLTFIYPFVFKYQGSRFFVTAYPFFVIMASYAINDIFRFFLKKYLNEKNIRR